MLIQDQAGREKLWQNIDYIKTGLHKSGFDTGNSQSGIIPIIIGDEEKLGPFHRELTDAGVYTNIVSYPAVRRKECRIRLCIMSTLTKKDMDQALSIIKNLGQKYQVI
ncbi:MAG: aminotransferase class I/II-fold pyridoxal phosphate-dependent enzyme [Phycisphaerae bacterium]|nr:aminotransferase class I/II-fold pyridoxal phosphate-dependent enzyme [Phycisphaerae bacterium]